MSSEARSATRFARPECCGSGRRPLRTSRWAVTSGWCASPLLEEHVRFARAVLDGVPGGPDRLLYARVDMARGEEGELLLLELECIEPRLFLEHAPARAGAVAGAFAAWLESSMAG